MLLEKILGLIWMYVWNLSMNNSGDRDMEKEDRLVDFITGKNPNICMTCMFFELDENDPQGVGGTCMKDGEFGFIYEYCDKFTKKEVIDDDEDNEDSEVVISDYKCPICGGRITQLRTQFAVGSIGCENECFEKLDNRYVECPVCKEGKMSKECYHRTMYIKCDNEKCGFEISPKGLINWLLKNK